MFEQLVPYLNHNLFPWVISFLILTFALSLWLFFRFVRLAPIVQQLQTAIDIVEQQSPENFSNEFEQLDENFQNLPLFQHQWSVFKHFIRAGKSNNSQLFYSRSPQNFFNTKTLITPEINLRFYQTVPNLFVQLGLLFTFFGLVVALYAVGNGLMSNELSELRASLHTLLAAATFKFLTSLSGILAAILFSWREKYHCYRLQQLINRFNQALEQFILPFTDDTTPLEEDSVKVEHTMQTRYTVSNTEIQKHSMQFEDIDSNLLMSINLGFNSIKKEIQRLNTGISVATRRLYKGMHTLGQQNEKSIDKQDDSFKDD